MIGYASRTGTKRNLAELKKHGWRLIVSARGAWRNECFKYGIDNGAWTSFQKGEPFDVDAFAGLVKKMGAGADWIVAPDIVMGGMESLEKSVSWLPILEGIAPILIPVQNGMTAEDLRPLVGPSVGIFVGGDTEWKESSMPIWGRLKRETGCYLHVGRVNTRRRILLCHLAGADSFDGTSGSRYAKTIEPLSAAISQQTLFKEIL